LVNVQAGPGDTQPGGVGPDVSQRFASPPVTEVVIPGVKRLELNDAEPVWFEVMSVIRTTSGVQPTLEFQENVELVAAAALIRLAGTENRVEIARIAMRPVRR